MSRARHTPPGDSSFRASVLRHLAAGVGVVVLVALLFAGVGRVRDGDAVRVDEAPPAAGPDDPEPADASEADPDEVADDRDQVAPDEPATDGAPDGDEAATGDDPDGTTATPALAPEDITIQVLDGSRGDGTAASAVATALREAGYRVVAENPAIAYEETTVLWTEGSEAAARQVAAELGAADVRAQPGNLSEDVDVHVVVGSDRT